MPEITYDPTDVDAGEFSADELDSLQVGEQLAQAEDRQLAGKYANAEELEQAYLNLQQKMERRVVKRKRPKSTMKNLMVIFPMTTMMMSIVSCSKRLMSTVH